MSGTQTTSSQAVTTGNWVTQTINGMQYDVLLPANYDPSIKYPTVLYLHQLDMGNDPSGLLAEVNPWFNTTTFRSDHPAIIVMPLLDQSSDPSGGTINFGGVSTADSDGENNAIAALKQVQGQYSTDLTRTYVTGNSMGGIGTEDMIIKYNAYTGTEGKIFAAGLSLAGADYGQGYPTPNASVVSALKNVPFWAIHGGQDTQVPLAWDQNLYAAEQASGGDMKYTQDDSLGHDVWDTYYPQTGTASPLGWLFGQSTGGVTTTPTPTPTSTPISTGTPSADDTVVTGTTSAITDASGNAWTITSAGQVAVNGTADTTTAGVTELAYVSGMIWQENSNNLWWGETLPNASWAPGAGTATSPLPATPTPTPAPTPTPTAVPSADDTVVTGTTAAITDAGGNNWTITSGGQVAVNGITDTTTAGVVELAYVSGTIWQENNNNLWWGKTLPTASWAPGAGTTSPLPATPSPTPSPTPTPTPTSAPTGTRDPSQIPFASTSVFNLPLGSGAQWQANTQLAAANAYINTANESGYNENIYTGTATDPLVTITDTAAAGGATGTFQVHIPVGAVAAPGSDQTFSVDDTMTHTWYGFGGFQWTGANTATVAQGSAESDFGSGIADNNSDWDEGVGTLRQSDLQAGTITHMLRMELPTTMLMSYSQTSTTTLAPYAWPQTAEDGFAINGSGNPAYSGTVPFGVTIGIPGTAIEPADVAANAGANMLWTALQDHGAMVRDSGGSGNTVIFQGDQAVNGSDPLILGMEQYSSEIMAATQILTNQGPNSVNGGGTPIVPLDPAPNDAGISTPTSTPTASPDDTVVTGTTAALTDTSGNNWTITDGGQVAVNGTADTTTAGVIELAYVGGTIWQENSNEMWWGETTPNASWSPAAGTATSPLPATPTPTPDPTPTPTPTGSANDTMVLAGSTDTIIDASGNKWTLTSNDQVAVNGVADTTTANVTELAYVNKAVWQENADALWWGKTSPTAAWAPDAGTSTSPLPAPITIASETASQTISLSQVSVEATAGSHMVFIKGSGDTVGLSGDADTITDTGGGNTYILPAAGKGTDIFSSNIFTLGDTLDLKPALGATNWDGAAATLSNYLTVVDSADGATLLIAATSGGTGTAIATISGATTTNLTNLLDHAIT